MKKNVQHIIVFVPFYTPYVGGIVSHSEEFTNAFAAEGVAVTVFVPQFKNLPKIQGGRDVRLIYYPAVELITHFPVPKIWTKKFWSAYCSLSDTKYDCVFSRTRFFPISLFAMLYAKTKKISWIHIEHGGNHIQQTGKGPIKFFSRLYDATLGRLIFRSCDQVISIAPTVHKFVTKYGRFDSPIIYRGLDMISYGRIHPDNSLKERFPNKIIVMWAGRMSYWKGVENIIQAIKLLAPETQNKFHCVLIGNGSERAHLEKMSRGLPISFLDSMPREKVIGLLKSSDIFIHSSYPGGGLSTALLEAMSCKNAIIASPYEGGEEVILHNDTGLLLQSNAPMDIAENLKILLANAGLRQQLGKKACEYVSRRFSWSNAVKLYIDVIQSLYK